MASNTTLSLVSLDPDTLTDGFKAFLRSQDRFKDYDFDGSNLTQVLRVLGYNTFQNAFYYNMAISEAFLDSAQARDSLVSHSKHLNYLPRSRRSAKAVVDLTVEATGITSLSIPRQTQFTASLDNGTYTFTTDTTRTVTSSNTTFTIAGLELYEGRYLRDTYIMNSDDETQRFIVTDNRVDTSSIIVTVVDSNNSETAEYTAATSLLDLTEDSKVYFIQGAENGSYEIVFGDNIASFRPLDRSVVIIEYRISEAELPNGSSAFTIDDDIAASSGGSLVSTRVVTTTSAAGGTEVETNDEIRFNAPRHFTAQERAIIDDDYLSALKNRFPYVSDVKAYGGDEVTESPQYGRVFISCGTFSGENLSATAKDDILAFIKTRMTLGMQPMYVNPEYTFIALTSTIDYNMNKTKLSSADIQQIAAAAVNIYDEDVLSKFGAKLRYSPLLQIIDDSDDAIESNDTSLVLNKIYVPVLNLPTSFNLNFQNPIFDDADSTVDLDEYSPAVYTTSFTSAGKLVTLQDNGLGSLILVESTTAGKVTVNTNVGTVDYTTGKLSISALNVAEGASIVFSVKPANRDIISSGQTILKIDRDRSVYTARGIRV